MELLPRKLQLCTGSHSQGYYANHGTRTSPHMACWLRSGRTFAPGSSHAGHSLTPGLPVQVTLQL